MYIHFSYYDGSNHYITMNNAELFRMVKTYQLDQVTDLNYGGLEND